MASVNSDVLYNYQSMRVKWSRCFEESDPQIAGRIKDFFQNFYKKHKHYTFAIGELFELFVRPATYRQIKEEIETQIEQTLPDVKQTRDATIIESEKSFQNYQEFKDFCKAQKDEHHESIER